MISKITAITLNIGTYDKAAGKWVFAPDIGLAVGDAHLKGADLAYGFKPSRSAWDKIGSYINFAVDSLSMTIAIDRNDEVYKSLEALKPGVNVFKVKIANEDGHESFIGKLSNSCIVSYPENVAIGVKYPVMLKYLRMDLMPVPAGTVIAE